LMRRCRLRLVSRPGIRWKAFTRLPKRNQNVRANRDAGFRFDCRLMPDIHEPLLNTNPDDTWTSGPLVVTDKSFLT
jgi:hypothetical protein